MAGEAAEVIFDNTRECSAAVRTGLAHLGYRKNFVAKTVVTGALQSCSEAHHTACVKVR